MALLLKKKTAEQPKKVVRPTLTKKSLTKKVTLVKVEKPAPKEKPKKVESLPLDEYTPLIPQVVIEISESQSLVLRATRGGELGLPRLDIREYVKTEKYTGFTKKGINIPLEHISDLAQKLHIMANSHPVVTALKDMEYTDEE